MAKVTTPVKGFTGQVVGVVFADGKGETEDAAAIAYFRRHGYTVEAAKAPSKKAPAKVEAAKAPSKKAPAKVEAAKAPSGE